MDLLITVWVSGLSSVHGYINGVVWELGQMGLGWALDSDYLNRPVKYSDLRQMGLYNWAR